MAEMVQLETQERKTGGSMAARRLRKQGLVPGVVYGHKEATVAVALNEEALLRALRHGARVVDLKIGSKVEKALIRELQWDHFGKELLHIDFRRTSADERVVVPVSVVLRGIAPGVAAGGALDQPLHSLQVECLVTAVPESIRVNISELQMGSVIHVKDLVLPPGVKVMGDPEALVVQVTQKQMEPEPTAAPAAESAEPEVITRAKPAEEEGE